MNGEQPTPGLIDRAARLWPDDAPHAEHNRREWQRAVELVRGTRRGWLIDARQARKEARA